MRDSSLFVYWVSRTVHSIVNHTYNTRPDRLPQMLRQLQGFESKQDGSETPRADPATLGFFTQTRLYGFCWFISIHMDCVPMPIIALFLNVIKTRVAAFTTWKALFARHPCINAAPAFKSFVVDIRGLWEIFNALGDLALAETTLAGRDIPFISSNDIPCSEEDVLAFLDRDKFPIRFRENQTRCHSKSKAKFEADLYKLKAILPPEDLSLNYFVIGTPAPANSILGKLNDFGMASYDLSKEFVRLRMYLQDIWREVAYGGLNSTVGAIIGTAALDLIEKYYSDIVPGHRCLTYMAFIQCLTGYLYYDSESYVPSFSTSAYRFRKTDGSCFKLFDAQSVDLKETFMIYTFESLVEFLSDFRATQDGKPTKAMAKRLQNWDHTIDLMSLTREEYIQWRHLYTIKLLYTLGPDCLTSTVAYLANLRPPPPKDFIRCRLMPVDVFVLQCLVDSFTVSRGYSYNPLTGPTLTQAPPADVFLPARDLALFLGVKLDSTTNEAAGMYQQVENPPKKLRNALFVCHRIKDFQSGRNGHDNDRDHEWSEFAWVCSRSPQECAGVLVQALRSVHSTSTVFHFGFYHEPVLLVHLHNMLFHEGYLTTPSQAIFALQKHFDALLPEEAKPPQYWYGAYDQALSCALERLRDPWRPSLFDCLTVDGTRPDQVRPLENLKILMEGDNANKKEKRAVQVKRGRDGSSKKANKLAIRGSRARAKAVMDGIQAVNFNLHELKPGTMLEAPDGSKVMVTFKDVLALLTADVTLGLHGCRCLDAVNHWHVTNRAKALFEFIEKELAAVKDPVYLEIYGDPEAKESESGKRGGAGQEAGKEVKTLEDKRRKFVLRLLTRSLDPPSKKATIDIVVKAFENKELAEFDVFHGGLGTKWGEKSDWIINEGLKRDLAAPSCPVM